MYGFIYITENLTNGKRYVGKRVYKGRWQYYLGSGTLLKKAIKAHGSANFKRTIIQEAHTPEELDELEKFYVEKFNAVDDPQWYNLVAGGGKNVTRGFAGRKHTEETKKRMREAQLGHPVSDKARKAVAATGRKSSQDPVARAKQAKAISGANHFRAKPVTIDGVTYPTITAARKAGYRYDHIKTLLQLA